MKLQKDQQLKVHSGEQQQDENKGTQPKIPQLKIKTSIRSGECWWDYKCEKYWC